MWLQEPPSMLRSQVFHDPLGNSVQVPEEILQTSSLAVEVLALVISGPAYLINERNEKIYFFRLIDWEVNVLVEAQRKEEEFVVSACIQNPGSEYISALLKKGSLFAFHH